MIMDRREQSKHWASKRLPAIESYWESPPGTKRSKWFCERLKEYQFDSIFEIGFFSGRNLKYIKDCFPSVSVGGLEINPRAVKFAKKKLNNMDLKCMDLHNMGKIDKRYDIVFTSGVLIHIMPGDIEEVLKNIVGMANKYVMHIEEIGNNIVTAGPEKHNPTYKISDQIQFANDLVGRYNSMGYEPSIVNLPDNVRTNGAKELLIIKI